jgi:two-component system chemotaxis response regulator CheY
MTVSSQRVLVVDDSSTMRAFVVAALESDGFEVTAAKSGFEALKILPGASFHLIVTDVNMPDINGLELVRYVRQSPNHKSTPLIIISTDGRDKDRDRGMQLGASAYLVKPFAPDALLSLARTVMAPGANIAPMMVQPASKKP